MRSRTVCYISLRLWRHFLESSDQTMLVDFIGMHLREKCFPILSFCNVLSGTMLLFVMIEIKIAW